ncbi:MAG: hypothetical protein HOC92_03165, partial [Gammaproteobacteria bacterium]|nr:hypothetical protein [Gammaproteobacteria bacterium]
MDFKQTSIKQSALGWVKKSIDEHLTTIRRELNTYIEEQDASMLTLVEEKLQAIQGVLSMIEQYGAAMLTEEMRSLCQYIAGKEQQDQQALEVLLRAVLQLPDYLENIQAGQKDIPIAILPLLNDIRAAKNEDLFSEKLLFLPDLSMHSDDGEYDAIDESKNQHTRLLAKKLRPTYQYSILGLMRDKDVETNLKRIGKITEVMEERSSSEQVARLWWIVGALIESVLRDNLSLGVSVKMLLGKVDQIFRSMLLKGEKELIRVQPIELIKNLLYYIAQPECDGPKSQAIKTAYRLEQFLPSSENQSTSNIAGPNQELLKTVSDAIKADIEEVKSALEIYVSGDVTNTQLLESIPAELHVISDTLAMIGLGPQRQLIESQITMITKVVEGEEEADSEKILGMAGELIQIDHALDLMRKGQFVHEGEEVTSTTVSRNFEMDNMLSAVVTAALDDIQKIKGAILDFIKDTSKEENIEFCKTLLQETRGALNLLNENKAVSITDGLLQYLENHNIDEFMQSNRLNQLSQVVVSIEYYLEAVGEQRADADSILDFAETQLQLLLEGELKRTDAVDGEFDDQENLLIDDSDAVEIDEKSLVDVDLSNMEADLQDEAPDIELTEPDSEVQLDEITEIEIPVVEIENTDQPEENIGEVVNDINVDLEEIQDVLTAEAASDLDEENTPLDEEKLELSAEINDEIDLDSTNEQSSDVELEIVPDVESLTGLESVVDFDLEPVPEIESASEPEPEP